MARSTPSVSQTEIEEAARLLRAGRLVAFPTETVYGLGANALDPEAVGRIYAAKGRPPTNPLIVHVASVEMAKALVTEWPATADRLAKKFWPGPLTLVLPTAFDRVPSIVTAGLGSVGLRMPAHPVALELIRSAGIPLAAPSANRFTHLSPTSANHVRLGLGSKIDFILDGGACEVGIESTVVSLAGPQPVLLRPGGVSRVELEKVIGPISVASGVPSGAHPAPGMHPRHYSPRTPLLLITNGAVPGQGHGIYLQHLHPSARADVRSVQMPLAAPEYAAVLYRHLHEADGGGYEWIAVDFPPQSHDWEAVRDRLRRASSKR